MSVADTSASSFAYTCGLDMTERKPVRIIVAVVSDPASLQ
jgi:hypothetical protein